MDGANDAKHADGKRGADGTEYRYYLINITRERFELAAPEASDFGTLDAGTHVVEAEYCFLIYKPGNPARWYVKGQPPRVVKVPTHLLLCVGFSMQTAQLGLAPSRQQKAAIQRGAVVLAEAQHDFAVAALQKRRGS